jgi:hypothetical protein
MPARGPVLATVVAALLAPGAALADTSIGALAATIVFARCQTPSRCHLARTSPAGGSETPIADSAATDGWESAPTVWGSRLAFARQYAHRIAARLLPPARRPRARCASSTSRIAAAAA